MLAKYPALMRQAGGSTEAATDEFQQFHAAVKNLKNLMASGFSTGPFGILLDRTLTGLNAILSLLPNLRNAYIEHSKEVLATAGSYHDYAEEMLRSAGVNVDFVTGQLVVNAASENQNKILAHMLGLLSQEEFAQIKAAQAGGMHARQMERLTAANQQYGEIVSRGAKAMTSATDEAAAAVDRLRIAVGGAVDNELANFEAAQARIREAIALYGDESGELQAQYEENAAAHEKMVHKIIFDMALQRAAEDGFSADEKEFLEGLAADWGLMGDKTVRTLDVLDQAFGALADGNLARADYVMRAFFGGLPASGTQWNYDINVNVHRFGELGPFGPGDLSGITSTGDTGPWETGGGVVTTPGGGTTTTPAPPETHTCQAGYHWDAGANSCVPDNVPQFSFGGDGDEGKTRTTIIYNTTINDQLAAKLFLEQQRRDAIARAERLM